MSGQWLQDPSLNNLNQLVGVMIASTTLLMVTASFAMAVWIINMLRGRK